MFVVTLVAARVVNGFDGDGDVGYRDDRDRGQQQERRSGPHRRVDRASAG